MTHDGHGKRAGRPALAQDLKDGAYALFAAGFGARDVMRALPCKQTTAYKLKQMYDEKYNNSQTKTVPSPRPTQTP